MRKGAEREVARRLHALADDAADEGSVFLKQPRRDPGDQKIIRIMALRRYEKRRAVRSIEAETMPAARRDNAEALGSIVGELGRERGSDGRRWAAGARS